MADSERGLSNNAIQPSTTQALVEPMGVPSAQELMVYQTWAKTAVESNMYRGIGKEAGVMMIMLAAREFGIGPAQALNGGLNIIEGKVELSARMMSALIRRARHSVQVLESTDKVCRIKGIRRDTGDTLISGFTIEEAQQAGLVKEKGAWRKCPQDMLFARAMSRLARQLFADVIGIGYVEGEINLEFEPPSIIDRELREDEWHEVSGEPLIFNEAEELEKILFNVDHADRELFMDFLFAIETHYSWSRISALQEMAKDVDKTILRFKEWKIKHENTN